MSAPKWEEGTGEGEARWENAGVTGVAAYAYTHTAKTKGKRKFLSFVAGETFTLVKQGQKEWWLAKTLSTGETGYIPVNFLVPIPPTVPVATTEAVTSHLAHRGWFHGNISREEAEVVLAGCDSGAFVVRESRAKPGAYSLSVQMSGGHCKHMKIVHVDGGVTLSGATDGMARPTLALLLEHYATLTLSDDVGVLLDVAGNGGAAATAAKRRVSARPAPAPPGSTNGTSQTRTAPPPPEADYGTDTGHPPVASSQVSTARTASSARIPARAAPLPPPPAAGPAAEALNLDAMEVDVPSEPTVGPPPIAHTSPKVAATTDDDELPDPTCEADFEVPPLLPEQMKNEVVQLVRDASGLSFEKSRLAAAVVVDYILQAVSNSAAIGVLDAVRMGGSDEEGEATEGADVTRLRVVIEELTAMKNDAQQRSWSIYDDSSVISEYLEEFLGLVTEADPRAVFSVITTYQSYGHSGRYEILDTLVVYYQMETRSSIREILLQLFAALCGIDAEVYHVLQDSQLPLELVRDVGSSAYGPGTEKRVQYSLLLATMVFSCGLPMPVTHYDTLDGTFVSAMSDVIEHTAGTETDEQISDQATDLLLSFNLHFEPGQPNLVMAALGSKRCVVLAQRLLLLVNRGEDPVAAAAASVADQGRAPTRNSVLKFLIDIFACTDTANTFFYSSDRNMLIDVIARELADRPHTDMALLDYVAVLRGLVAASGYTEDDEPYRQAELLRSLQEQSAAINEYMGSLELLEGVTAVLGHLSK